MSFRIDQLAVLNLATVGNSITAGSFVKSGGTSSQFLKADGSVDSSTYITGITSGMITTALGYTPVPNTRTLTINGTAYDLSADRSWTIAAGVSSVTASGAGITASPTTGAVVISNTGVTSNVAGTGISVSGATGAVTITNTGVTSIVAGTGISISGATGAVTVTNAGVTSVNGSTGAVTGIITTSNYNSYSPTLTGTGASGTWGISITGSAANSTTVGGLTPIQFFNNMGNNHSTYTNFNSIPDFGFRFVQGTTNGPGTGAAQFYTVVIGLGNEYPYSSYAMQIAFPRWETSSDRYVSFRTREATTWGSWSKISAGYADSAGNADTVDGYHATNAASGLAYYASNGYLYVPSWINIGTAGIFSGTNNAHIRPNQSTSYGAWEMIGSRSGWSGIWFNDSGNHLMMNNNESGHYMNGYGWQFRWYQGTMYINRSTYGGTGTEYTMWDSGNLTNLNQLSNGPGYITGNQTITLSGDVSGSGATSISVTVNQIDGWSFVNTGSNAGTAADSINSNGITYVATNISLFGQSDGALFSQAYSSSWQHQIYGDYRTGQIALRGKNSGTWQAWRVVLDSSNYSSYIGGVYLPYGNWAGTTGMNDNKLYLRTNGDNNHYLWNAGDDWEELNAYEGTGFRITSVGGSVGVLYVYGSSNGGYTYSPYSFRAPIFYDSDNTTYYANFADTGTSINIAGSVNAATYNKPGLLLNASGSSSSGAAFGMQQITSEGWTGIFVDYEPYTGWGLYHDNPNNYFLITSESSSGNFGSHTVPSRSSGNRTAYVKHRFDQNNGEIYAGGLIYSYASVRAPIFYDSDDTNYYADFHSTSNSGIRLRGGMLIGPNTTWGAYLQVGGNGHVSSSYANVVTTNGNLHLDASSGRDIYLGNYVNSTIYLNTSGYYISSNGSYYNGRAELVTVNSGNGSASWYPILWHSGNNVYSSSGTAEIYPAGGYARFNYINTSDNDESGITRFVIKNGDNYHRSATTTVAADIIRGVASGTWSINITGNAGSASSVAWGNVSGKPSNIMYYQSFTLDANTMDSNATGFTYSVNAPYTGPVVRFSTGGGYDLWLNAPYYSNGYGLAFRTRNGDSATLNSWQYPAVYGVNANGGGDLYATRYYDQNDTGYYCDPASESNLWRFTAAAMTRNAINYLSINSPYTTRPSQGVAYQNGTMGWGQIDFNTIFSNWGSGFIDTWSNPGNAPGGSSHYVGLQGMHYNFQNSSQGYGFQMACAGEADNRFFWRSAWPNLRSWVEMMHSANSPYAWNMNQYVRTSDNVEFNQVSVRASLYVGTYQNSSDIYMTDGDEGTRRIHCNSNRVGFLNQSAGWGSYCDDTGNWISDYGVYASDWFRTYGYTGLYSQSYGSHIRPTANASHGTWEIFGYTKGGYNGLNVYDSAGYINNYMHESGNGGLYQENGSGWIFYWYRPNSCLGIGTSSTSSAYKMYVNGSIYATGDVVAYSDKRKKTDIVTIDNALDKVTNMRGVFYTKIGEEEKGRKTGVIAQEVNEILPEAVTYAADIDEYGVAYGNIVGVLIEAIKEQQKQIEELKSKLDGTSK